MRYSAFEIAFSGKFTTTAFRPKSRKSDIISGDDIIFAFFYYNNIYYGDK